MSDNEEDISHVVKDSEEKEIDLFEAINDAEEQRRNALAEELRKQAKKKSKLIDPLAVWDLLEDIELADYEPSFKWEEADATDRQIDALCKFGIDASGLTKGYACHIMDKLIGRANDGMASIKQIRVLKKYGYEPVSWTFEQANKKISALAAVGWKRWRLHE